jgi:succinate dehydrogenase / fumarate reductase cytochrome b subunit
VKTVRPVNLDLSTFSFPLTAITSILHRISGVVLLLGAFAAVWFLASSLRSPADFMVASAAVQTPIGKFLTWGFLAALLYHLVMGLKHLVQDLGFGETLSGSKTLSLVALIISVVLVLAAGVWVW